MTFDDIFTGSRVMAIFRGLSVAKTLDLAERAWDAGVTVLEVTVQDAEAIDALRATVEAGRARDRVVGAGTVTSVGTMRAALDAGADFTVSPAFNADLVDAHSEVGIPHLPGIATPSELDAALRAGCSWVKVFPAAPLGPGWFSAMRGPYPQAKFVATGGIMLTDCRTYLNAGADVVGLGTAIAAKDAAAHIRALIDEG